MGVDVLHRCQRHRAADDGWLATFFGRKRLLILSITAFTLALPCGGVAPNLPVWSSSESWA
jgi:MFS family permease